MGSLSIYHLFYYLAGNPICSTSCFWFKYVSFIFQQNGQWVSADTINMHFIATCFSASPKSAYNIEHLLAVNYFTEAADKRFCINQTQRRRSQGQSNRPKHNLSRFTLRPTTTQLSWNTVIAVSFSSNHQNNRAQSSCCFDKVFTSHSGGSEQKNSDLKTQPGSMLYVMRNT